MELLFSLSLCDLFQFNWYASLEGSRILALVYLSFALSNCSIAINELQNLYLGWLVFTGTATFYAFLPLISLFDPNPPEELTDEYRGDVENTALVIPAYKSEKILPATLIAALKIFPPEHIFVICNGNSPTPLDGSEDVCKQYSVNHIWYVPISAF
jgi:hypothetical protein